MANPPCSAILGWGKKSAFGVGSSLRVERMVAEGAACSFAARCHFTNCFLFSARFGACFWLLLVALPVKSWHT